MKRRPFIPCIGAADQLIYKTIRLRRRWTREEIIRTPNRIGPEESSGKGGRFRVCWPLVIVGMVGFHLGGPFPSFGDIYKYVDRDGVVHFTNVPTSGKFEVVIKEKRVEFQVGPELGKYDHLILKTADRYNIDYALVKAVIKAESNFNPAAVSRVGARGLMQLMPGTAQYLQVKDSFHPAENIEGGVRYLRYLLDLFRGNLQLALAAYNAGENTVLRYKGIPPYPETRTYIQRVMHYFQKFSTESRKPANL